jgi:hypothetical protein
MNFKQSAINYLRHEHFGLFLKYYFGISEWRRSILDFEKVVIEWDLEVLGEKPNECHWKRESDTLFILGSGPSINHLDKQFWEVVAANDSVGMNFWLVHHFTPSFYHGELIDLGRPGATAAMNALFHWMDIREVAYQNTPFLLSELQPNHTDMLSRMSPAWRQRVIGVPTVYPVFANSEEGTEVLLYLKKRDFFTPNRIKRVMMYQSSVTKMIVLGLLMGYKRLVLCGVDLNVPGYFFEDREVYPLGPNLRRTKGEEEKGVHNTQIQAEFFAPVSTAILLLRDLILEPLGISLELAHPSSLLYPDLSVFEPGPIQRNR